MSNWFADDKKVRVRVPHACEACGGSIEPGETAIYQRGRFEGDFFSRHLHPACQQIWYETVEDDYLGDFWEGLYYWLERHLGEAEAKICRAAASNYFLLTRPGARPCLQCGLAIPRKVHESTLWCSKACAEKSHQS